MALTKIKGSGLSSDALTTVRSTVASVPLTQLEVSGTVTANAFVGDGSGLTGVTSYTDSDTAAYLVANGYATATSVIATITDAAPSTLDTLNELAAALGDDPNFATTVTNSIATKAPLADPTFTGTVTADGLTVNSGTTNTTAIFQSTDAGAYILVTDPTGTSSIAAEGQYMYIDVDKDALVANSEMRFRVDGSTKVTLDTSGNLLVGKTSSSGATVGCELQPNGFVRGTRDGGAPLGLNRKTSDGSIAVFEKDSISVGTISVTSSGTTYNTTSDYRLKDNVQPITDGAERIQKLKPVTHSWKADPDTTVDGFLAHEVQEAGYEYAVNGEKDGDDMQSMDYGRITPVIVAALQDALKEIEQLKARINELEAK